MPRGVRLDLTGQRFGRLLVVERAGSVPASGGKATVVLWRVRCDCGTEKVMWSSAVRAAHGCGCVRTERARETRTTHGETAWGKCSAEYTAWKAMRRRCDDADGPSYALYAGRGIYVCPRWREDFASFLADMGRRPSSGHSVDRIDTNGSYTCGKCDDCATKAAPMNCRWADAKTQQRNRRDNNVVTVDGVTRTLADWAEVHGIHRHTLETRMRRGCPLSALFEQPRKRRPTARALRA